MDFTEANTERIRLKHELEQVQTQLASHEVSIRIQHDHVYTVAIPLALRKTHSTRLHREKREKRENEMTLHQLRTYFRKHNIQSEQFDPTPYEIPHTTSFDDMLTDYTDPM